MNVNEVKTYTGKYVEARVENGTLKEIRLVSHIPQFPDLFDNLIQELKMLRKSLWPMYTDSANQSVTFATRQPVRHLGRVKWYNDAKGYGYLKTDDDGREVYVHFSAIRKEGFKTLAENERVTFEIREIRTRLTAFDVISVGECYEIV